MQIKTRNLNSQHSHSFHEGYPVSIMCTLELKFQSQSKASDSDLSQFQFRVQQSTTYNLHRNETLRIFKIVRTFKGAVQLLRNSGWCDLKAARAWWSRRIHAQRSSRRFTKDHKRTVLISWNSLCKCQQTFHTASVPETLWGLKCHHPWTPVCATGNQEQL